MTEYHAALGEAVAMNGGKRISSILSELFDDHLSEALPRRLTDSLIDRAGVRRERRGAELSNFERQCLADRFKNTIIALSGTRGFEKAEVTAGGVALNEVDSRTMESKLVPGLFIAGEVLDLDGFIGGYNFQAAFSTGWLAGESV
jgi:predicted Rossmann fold flavoprotein